MAVKPSEPPLALTPEDKIKALKPKTPTVFRIPRHTRAPDFSRVLIACMPKSGSTYLATIISCLPEMRQVHLVPAYERREQELDIFRLREVENDTRTLRRIEVPGRNFLFMKRTTFQEERSRARGYVAQHHVRYSVPTDRLLVDYRIAPVVLVRNIFDIVASLRDYLVIEPDMSMGYFSEEMRTWPPARIVDFLVEMVVPWYFNFYVCWLQCPYALTVTYEELTADPADILKRVVDFAKLPYTAVDLEAAIRAAGGKNTKKNQAVVGRGANLPKSAHQKIAGYAKFYPNTDFSRMGL